jgi:hypothetical protein
MDQFFIRREGELVAIASPSSLDNILSFPHASPEISSWSLITQYKKNVVAFGQSGSESQLPHQQSPNLTFRVRGSGFMRTLSFFNNLTKNSTYKSIIRLSFNFK